MTIFAVVADSDSDRAIVESAIKRSFPHDHLHLGANVWLVSANGISKDVSDRLELGEPNRTGVVLAVHGYYGFSGPHVWEWLKSKGNGKVT